MKNENIIDFENGGICPSTIADDMIQLNNIIFKSNKILINTFKSGSLNF